MARLAIARRHPPGAPSAEYRATRLSPAVIKCARVLARNLPSLVCSAVDTLLDFLGSLLDWGPIGFIGRRWVRRYEAGRRVFTKGTVSGLTGSPRWATWLVANGHWLFVADQKGDTAPLYPLPAPALDSTLENVTAP